MRSRQRDIPQKSKDDECARTRRNDERAAAVGRMCGKCSPAQAAARELREEVLTSRVNLKLIIIMLRGIAESPNASQFKNIKENWKFYKKIQ